jgi:hypothetical protein
MKEIKLLGKKEENGKECKKEGRKEGNKTVEKKERNKERMNTRKLLRNPLYPISTNTAVAQTVLLSVNTYTQAQYQHTSAFK